jgi:outer membrane protein assembly factor BamA
MTVFLFSAMRKLLFAFFLLWHTLLAIASEPADTLVQSRRSILVVPSLAHQPETSWAGGIAYGVCLKSNDLSRISSITGGVTYTLRNQFAFSLTPRIFWGQSRWYIYSSLSLKNYPDFYYGISNRPTSVRQAFRSRNLSVLLQPQIQVAPHLLLGVSVAGRYERVDPVGTTDTEIATLQSRFGSEGWSPYAQLSLGGLLAYDSRDNQFYPVRGGFLKAVASVASKHCGSTYSLLDVSVDGRKYISLFSDHVVAMQAWTNAVWGNSGVPFQLLPTLGGLDVMRGLQRGMYRGTVAAALQTEYRMPVYAKLKAAMFASVGDVWNKSGAGLQPKFCWGAGLRYPLNDAQVHLRMDVARDTYGGHWQYYITASEAF